MDLRYQKSQSMLKEVRKTIPLGAQTFSKSYTQYPQGVSPHYVDRGEGSRVWDVDGNEYIDFNNALLAVSLGYKDPDVDAAVRNQFEKGVSFGLAHPIESEMAAKIIEMVPCAEMVRFGKNGSDATSGAVRIARAYTKRDRVAMCGYHGWHDWCIGTTSRNLGVPKAVSDLTIAFAYNDLAAVEKIFKDYPDDIAAVVMEPMSSVFPKAGFLEGVRELCTKHNTVLIFDEMITGFRFAKGGAQEYFNVTPDLCALGKGMANGYPLSAIAGKAEIMRLMEEIFFSFTAGGETVSLAAGLATITKLGRPGVLEKVSAQGATIKKELAAKISENQLDEYLSVGGHDAWSFLFFKDGEKFSQWQMKTLYLQEMFERGIITLGTHNLSHAHSEADIATLLTCYDQVLEQMADAVMNDNMESKLRTEVLVPLFKVRS